MKWNFLKFKRATAFLIVAPFLAPRLRQALVSPVHFQNQLFSTFPLTKKLHKCHWVVTSKTGLPSCRNFRSLTLGDQLILSTTGAVWFQVSKQINLACWKLKTKTCTRKWLRATVLILGTVLPRRTVRAAAGRQENWSRVMCSMLMRSAIRFRHSQSYNYRRNMPGRRRWKLKTTLTATLKTVKQIT